MKLQCFRCDGALIDVSLEELTEIKFFACEHCPCQYTKNVQGRLHDRWLMPMTLALYAVLDEENPLLKVDYVVKQMLAKGQRFTDALIEHIYQELENPQQQLTDMHSFSYPDENKLRQFLLLVKQGVEKAAALEGQKSVVKKSKKRRFFWQP